MPIQLPIADPVGAFFVVLAVLLLAPFLAERLRLPAIVGLCLAGVLVGPHGLGVVERDASVELLGTVGLLYIFFLAGAELDMGALKRRGGATLGFGLLTFALPFGAGYAAGVLAFGMGGLAALLFGSLFASHTLLSYPVAAKLGLQRHRAVAASAGATILTDALAMGILAWVGAVAADPGGTGSGAGSALLGLALGGLAWALALGLILPRLAGAVLKRLGQHPAAEFVFILAMLYLAAWTGDLVGLKPIIGAFYAGLLLGRYLPPGSALMARVSFVGEALFVPVFLVYVGMLVDLPRFLGSPASLGFAGLMLLVILGSKGLAALALIPLFRFKPREAGLAFGLTVNQAAATLATALVGFELGLFDEVVLDGTIAMIVATSLAGGIATKAAGSAIARERPTEGGGAREESKEPPSGGREAAPGERLLVALSNPQTLKPLLELGSLLRSPGAREPLRAVSVVLESGDRELELSKAENVLAQAMVYAQASGLPLLPGTRIGANPVEGILQAAREGGATAILLGWNRPPRISGALFGNAIEQVVRSSPAMVLACRLPRGAGAPTKLALVLPPLADRHPGFERGLALLASYVGRTKAQASYLAQADELAALRARLPAARGRLAAFRELQSWKDAPREAKALGAQAIVVLCARPGGPAWHPAAEQLPQLLAEARPEAALIAAYLPETESGLAAPGGGGEAVPAAMGAEGAEEAARATGGEMSGGPAGAGLFGRSLSAGRVLVAMPGGAVADGVRDLLSRRFAGERKALQRLSAIFSEMARAQPIELAPGVVLLHAHVGEVEEPTVFFGASPKGFRVLSLENPLRIVILLCAPEGQPPESHIATLGEIAALFADGSLAARLLAAASVEELRGG